MVRMLLSPIWMIRLPRTPMLPYFPTPSGYELAGGTWLRPRAHDQTASASPATQATAPTMLAKLIGRFEVGEHRCDGVARESAPVGVTPRSPIATSPHLPVPSTAHAFERKVCLRSRDEEQSGSLSLPDDHREPVRLGSRLQEGHLVAGHGES